MKILRRAPRARRLLIGAAAVCAMTGLAIAPPLVSSPQAVADPAAAAAPAAQSAAVDEQPEPGPVPELSTATSDTTLNADGTYTAKVYSAPVNYQDDTGDWVPIDNNLVDAPGATYAVENAGNDYTVTTTRSRSQRTPP